MTDEEFAHRAYDSNIRYRLGNEAAADAGFAERDAEGIALEIEILVRQVLGSF